MTFEFKVVLDAFPVLLQGLWMTLILVAASLLLGIAIGLFVCAGRILRRGVIYYFANIYVGIFRGLPETVMIFWVYYCGPLLLNVKLSGPASGILALTLPAGAYLAEIFRAGIEAVPRGQVEAARALGLSEPWVAWHVVAPQAIRMMTAPFVGFVTILLKNSSLVSAVGVAELFYRAVVFGDTSYRYLEIFTTVGVIYFCLIFPLSLAAQYAERRVALRQQ
ncbi:MAG TPA: amino acid ABC transporter permease [Alphaproteobacteria bacterium]|nr:amino acid ABC transporter permease [Alphaproteobacteria bacterium]